MFQTQFVTKIKLLLFFLAITFSVNSYSAQLSCESLFKPSFLTELVRTRGGSLFLKSPNDVDKTKFASFLTFDSDFVEQQKKVYSRDPDLRYEDYLAYSMIYFKKLVPLGLGYVLQLVPHKMGFTPKPQHGYRFSPLKGLQRVFIDAPTEALSRELLYTTKQPSGVVKFGLYLYLFIKAFGYYNETTYDIFTKTIQQQIIADAYEHRSKYLDLIENDFRYDQIKQKINNKEMTLDAGVEAAAGISKTTVLYYESRLTMSKDPSVGEQDAVYGDFPLFARMNSLINKAPIVVTDDIKAELYKVTRLYLAEQEAMDKFLFIPGALEKYRASPQKNEIIDDIIVDPFTDYLFQKNQAGVINQKQLKYYLQEYTTAIYVLRMSEILCMAPYVGKDRHAILDLDYARALIMVEIEKRN